jgi:uncharacterized protein YabE (DUF348 family)
LPPSIQTPTVILQPKTFFTPNDATLVIIGVLVAVLAVAAVVALMLKKKVNSQNDSVQLTLRTVDFLKKSVIPLNVVWF